MERQTNINKSHLFVNVNVNKTQGCTWTTFCLCCTLNLWFHLIFYGCAKLWGGKTVIVIHCDHQICGDKSFKDNHMW